MKIVIVILCILATGYTLMIRMTDEVLPNNKVCDSTIMRTIANWDAGCYYTAYFDRNNSVDEKQLTFEQEKLETFASKGGVAPDILWYRLKFHQKYQAVFRTNFRELHLMYLDYLSSQHIILDRQTDYLHFLQSSDLLPLAQNTLNDFCDTYILTYRENRIQELRRWLTQKDVSLSLEHCETGPH